MVDLLRQCEPTQEVGQVVGHGNQLQSRLIVFECASGELRPLDGVLPFLNPRIGDPATVVELHKVLRVFGQVGHDEPDARVSFRALSTLR